MKTIKKDTALITAATKDNKLELGLSAKKIINFLVFGIQNWKLEKDEDGWYTVDIKRIKQEFGFSKYKAIKKWMLQLQDLQLIYDQSNKHREKWTAFSFLRMVEYTGERWKKGVYKFKIEDMLEKFIKRPYVYTRLHLRITKGFNNKYAINIYEIAKDFLPVKNEKMEIDEFRRIIGCWYDNNITLFFKRVVEPATKEINEKTEINVNYKKIKDGRSYKYIKLNFSYKNADIRQELISEYEINRRVVDQIMIKFLDDIDILKQLLKKIKWKWKQWDIDNLGWYTYNQLVKKANLEELRKKKQKENGKNNNRENKPFKNKDITEKEREKRRQAAKKHLGKRLKNVDDKDSKDEIDES